MKIRQKSAWIFEGSSGTNIGGGTHLIFGVMGEKGTIKLKKLDSASNATERLTLYYGSAGLTAGISVVPLDFPKPKVPGAPKRSYEAFMEGVKGSPVDVGISTASFPDVGDVYITANVSRELTADDFDGLCFIHTASLGFTASVTHTMLFFGIPWNKIPIQIAKGVALNVIDWKSYLIGPAYRLWKLGKLVLGKGGDLPDELRVLAGEAKGIIIIKGMSAGLPVLAASVSAQFGYVSSKSDAMPWEFGLPKTPVQIEMDYRNTGQDKSYFSLPGDVLFGFDRAEIGSGQKGEQDAESTLHVLAWLWRTIKVSTLLIEGHTDSIGPPEYNLSLSMRRANAVRTWLLTKGKLNGVLTITSAGHGETRPLAPNTTATGRESNRRVEFLINGAF